jgi:hypothetical protein
MADFETRKMGRPPRAETAALGRYELRMTAKERDRWERAAKAEKLPLADWIRVACEDRIKRTERRKAGK